MEENELDAVVDGQGMRDENINISDVIEVIETDPDFRESPAHNTNTNTMYNGGGEIPNYVPAVQQQQQQPQQRSGSRSGYQIKITEQPAPKALRFRYECEGRSAGSIPGASSTPENKTYPSIKVVGGPPRRAVVVVSCVTKDPPYKPHPHNLVGREGCKKGVCTLEISPETMSVTFSNLGIQCVKKKDIESALRVREEIRVDPFRTGYSHRNQPTSIDLNTVRLCFQVFLENETQKGKYTVQLEPKVSEPIYDKKAMSDLNIIKLSDCVSYVDGGRKDIILLCEKVAKEDIQVRFYEENEGQIVWDAQADIQPSQVHKQHAIWFRTPRYRTLDVTDAVNVKIQLRRPSDGAASEPLPFQLLPLDSGKGSKKKRALDSDYSELLGHEASNYLQVKHEPRESTSPFFAHQGLSPQGYNIVKDPSPIPSPDNNFYAHSPEVYNLPYTPMNIGPNTWETGAASRNPTRSPMQIDPNWNAPSTSNNPSPMNIPPGSWNQSSTTNPTPMQVSQQWTLPTAASNATILDMDNHQINSAELNNMMNIPDLNNLSLSDIVPDQNTTDSLTNFVNSRAEDFIEYNKQ